MATEILCLPRVFIEVKPPGDSIRLVPFRVPTNALRPVTGGAPGRIRTDDLQFANSETPVTTISTTSRLDLGDGHGGSL